MGRPRHGIHLKNAAVSVKLDPDLVQYLRGSAERNGCSFMREIERRLEQSRSMRFESAAYHSDRLLAAINAVLVDIEELTGGNWNRTEETVAMTQGAVFAAVRLFEQGPTSRVRRYHGGFGTSAASGEFAADDVVQSHGANGNPQGVVDPVVDLDLGR